MDFKTFALYYFNCDADKALQHLANEAHLRDYSLTGSREEMKAVLDTLSKEEAEVFMRYLKKAINKDEPQFRYKHPRKVMIVILVISLVFVLWGVVIAALNFVRANESDKNGYLVEVTVTNIESKYEGGEKINYYTYLFEYDEKTYCFSDYLRYDYDVGDKFSAIVDPEDKSITEISYSILVPAFMLLMFFGAALFALLKKNFWAKYGLYVIMGFAGSMAATGFILHDTVLCICALVVLVATVVIWLSNRKKAAEARRSY